ncbi:bacterial lipid A biosynthesis acyltransferase family protein [Chlamydia ibidis]|uniref:Bacterial lipid A biosynthesis acyltransferase family protein n=2 Tax=Chlamydia ibidis TaxID=1405396 RepID=S7KKS2_9CHLA|nr:bacterial lipid A biosynthesis acyltransferase family protein [Chlamydia ibidis]EPP35045.1 bacterial lipid A biosynthesis acyltransferase family protein [Chlamydia ibidis]EQM62582.1 bacterial lipid A biosynthesis acyltransferase family protein [Chlamydia ibidis 10-1398/6]
MFLDGVTYVLSSLFISICKRVPYSFLKFLGHFFGLCIFYLVPKYRKTALTNLALAFPNKSYKERYSIARQSVQHTVITILELLAVESLTPHLDDLITIDTAEKSPQGFSQDELMTQEELLTTFTQLDNKEGLILFCGHQANWELPFLFITRNYPGLAFAKPINNIKLNRKIIKLRESFKGRIVSPKGGVRHALRALNEGWIIGIVGDQSLLTSSYTYPLFGSDAFTTTSPGLLAYKTGKPVVSVSISRHNKGYKIALSNKFYADRSLPIKEASSKLMDNVMHFLEKGIAAQPEQWMWMHKRWKRKLVNKFKKRYAYSHILVLVKETNLSSLETFLQDLSVFYSGATLDLAVQTLQTSYSLPEAYSNYNLKVFSNLNELYDMPNSYPAVFDLINLPRSLRKHYKKTGSVALFTQKTLEKKCLTDKPLISSLKSFSRQHTKINTENCN